VPEIDVNNYEVSIIALYMFEKNGAVKNTFEIYNKEKEFAPKITHICNQQ
jgi:hypothetical protein